MLASRIVESMYGIGAGQQIVGTTAYGDYPKAAENTLRVASYAGYTLKKSFS